MISKVTITEERAAKIDSLLKRASATNPIVTVEFTDREEKDEYIAIGNLLDDAGLGKWLGSNAFQIYPEGMIFAKDGGFTRKYKERLKEIEREERQDQLTAKQIKAAKREPYLIIWGIISTIINLILLGLQLLHS